MNAHRLRAVAAAATLLLLVAASTPSQAAGGAFTDLGGYNWAQGDISLLQSRGIMQGVGGALFAPGATLTRAEFAALLQRVFQLTSPSGAATFADVPASSWAADAVAAAAPYVGALLTPSGSAFLPGLAVARIDVAAAIGQLEVADGMAQPPAPAQAQSVWAGFTDGGGVPPGLSAFAAAAVQSGIMKGDGTGAFGVAAPLTRAQAAVVMARVVGALPGALGPTSALSRILAAATATSLTLTGGQALPLASGAAITVGGEPGSLAAGQAATLTLNAQGQVMAVAASDPALGVRTLSGALVSAGGGSIALSVGGQAVTIRATGSLPAQSSGQAVTVAINAAGQAVGFVGAASTVTGTLAGVTGSTVQLTVGGTTASYSVAAGVTVTLNGQPAGLGDLLAGETVTASLDGGGNVTALVATGGAGSLTGTITAVYANSLAIEAGSGTQTYPLAAGAIVTLNGQMASLSAIVSGETATATLNAQGQLTGLAVVGSSAATRTGTVVGANSAAIVLSVGGANQSLPLVTGVNVTLNGQVTGLASVLPGDAATVILNPQGQVTSIALGTSASAISGTVVSVNAVDLPYTIVLDVSGALQTFTVPPDATVSIGGAAGALSNVTAGEKATVTVDTTTGQVTAITTAAQSTTGYIVSATPTDVTLAVYAGATTYPMAANAQITVNGASATAAQIPLGAAASVGAGGGNTAVIVVAATPPNQVIGTLTAISATQATLTVNGVQEAVPLGPAPAAYSGGTGVSVTALPVGQSVTIDPGVMAGSALLVH